MKTSLLLTITLVLTSCGSRKNGTDPMPMIQGNTVDVSFRSGHRELPIYYHENAYYLLGEEGIDYSICLRNQAPVRIEAVLSVDGRDVVSGRKADYRTDRGYVLEPREEICVAGFRESTDSVAAFTFTAPEASYASQMGDGSNVGVIGIATFDEAEAAPRSSVIAQSPAERSYNGEAVAQSAPAAEDAAKEGIGTAYGESISSQAEVVPFVRRDATRPAEIAAVYYDHREGLESRGIRISKDIELSRNPTPFPGVDNGSGFAPPPPQ